MIGDKGWLSTHNKPNIVARHYKWAPGDSMPKYYLRLAEQTVQSGMRSVRRAVIGTAAAVACVNSGYFLMTLHTGFRLQTLAWLIGVSAFAALLLALMYFSQRKSTAEKCIGLQNGEFKWRTGRLDEIVGEVVDYRYDDDGREPVIRLYAYVDGEKVVNPIIFGTKVTHSASEFFTQKTTVKIRRTGKLHLGSQVTLIKPAGGGRTYIIPQKVDFDEH